MTFDFAVYAAAAARNDLDHVEFSYADVFNSGSVVLAYRC